jgi:hypothetical protein
VEEVDRAKVVAADGFQHDIQEWDLGYLLLGGGYLGFAASASGLHRVVTGTTAQLIPVDS